MSWTMHCWITGILFSRIICSGHWIFSLIIAGGTQLDNPTPIHHPQPVPGAGRGAGRPDSPPFRTHRAQFRQWAQDKAIHVATGRELEQRMADRNLRQRISPDI
jgi:hypothetical protein